MEQTTTNPDGERIIYFKNLSYWLKFIVIMGYIMAALYGLYFLIGFIDGVRAG